MTEDSIRLSAGRPARAGDTGGARTPARRGTPNLPAPSEAIVFAVLVATILIAAAIADNFQAPEAFRFVTYLGVAYIISRGLAKRDRGDDVV